MQFSEPGVKTMSSPSWSRHFAGTATLPLESILLDLVPIILDTATPMPPFCQIRVVFGVVFFGIHQNSPLFTFRAPYGLILEHKYGKINMFFAF